MLSFRIRNLVPPGGRYFYLVPETGVRLEGFVMSSLESQIRAHYISNKLECPKDILTLIEDHMCRYMPKGFCHGRNEGDPLPKVVILNEIKKATNELAAGNPRVNIGVARSRAVICSGCVKNDKSMCPTCIGLVGWAQRLAGASIGGMADCLGVCSVDATALPAKVHMTNVPDSPEYPGNCWRKKNGSA